MCTYTRLEEMQRSWNSQDIKQWSNTGGGLICEVDHHTGWANINGATHGGAKSNAVEHWMKGVIMWCESQHQQSSMNHKMIKNMEISTMYEVFHWLTLKNRYFQECVYIELQSWNSTCMFLGSHAPCWTGIQDESSPSIAPGTCHTQVHNV